MSLDSAIYALSNVNAILGSANGYVRDTQNGVSPGAALSNMGFNILNGAIRNEASREILNRSGSYMGYAVNSIAGYGDPVANYQGTVGTMTAAMLTQPFGIFGNGCCRTSSLYGCGPFGGYSGGYFGGYNMYSPFLFSGPSCFSRGGYWC